MTTWYRPLVVMVVVVVFWLRTQGNVSIDYSQSISKFNLYIMCYTNSLDDCKTEKQHLKQRHVSSN